MGLRAKLPITFLILLTAAILAVSAIYLNRMLRLMAHGLVVSADRCSKEVFEQTRLALANPGVPPVQALREDEALQAAIQSAVAFSDYVVYLRIVAVDGRDLIGSETGLAPQNDAIRPVLPILDLEQIAASDR